MNDHCLSILTSHLKEIDTIKDRLTTLRVSDGDLLERIEALGANLHAILKQGIMSVALEPYTVFIDHHKHAIMLLETKVDKHIKRIEALEAAVLALSQPSYSGVYSKEQPAAEAEIRCMDCAKFKTDKCQHRNSPTPEIFGGECFELKGASASAEAERSCATCEFMSGRCRYPVTCHNFAYWKLHHHLAELARLRKVEEAAKKIINKHDGIDWVGCESVKYVQSCRYGDIINNLKAALEAK